MHKNEVNTPNKPQSTSKQQKSTSKDVKLNKKEAKPIHQHWLVKYEV